MTGFWLTLQLVCVMAGIGIGWMLAKAEEQRDRMKRAHEERDRAQRERHFLQWLRS